MTTCRLPTRQPRSYPPGTSCSPLYSENRTAPQSPPSVPLPPPPHPPLRDVPPPRTVYPGGDIASSQNTPPATTPRRSTGAEIRHTPQLAQWIETYETADQAQLPAALDTCAPLQNSLSREYGTDGKASMHGTTFGRGRIRWLGRRIYRKCVVRRKLYEPLAV